MVAKIEVTNGTNVIGAVIRIFTSVNNFAQSEAAVARLTLSPPDRNNPVLIAGVMSSELQEFLDRRQLLATLPNDDPDKTTDPALGEFLFWLTIGPNTFLVSREGVVTVTWNGTEYVPSWRQSRRS